MNKPQAKQVLAQHGKSFYWASLFLGANLADRAARLYQFCRFVDDLADGDLPDRLDSLEDIRAGLDDPSHPAVSQIPELNAFVSLANEANIPLRAARELLDGMLRDQHPTALTTENRTAALLSCSGRHCGSDDVSSARLSEFAC